MTAGWTKEAIWRCHFNFHENSNERHFSKCFDISWTVWFILMIIVGLNACENIRQKEKKNNSPTNRTSTEKAPSSRGLACGRVCSLAHTLWTISSISSFTSMLTKSHKDLWQNTSGFAFRNGTLALQSSRLYTWGQWIQVRVLQGCSESKNEYVISISSSTL